MITKRNRNKIKKVLGSHYTQDVLKILNSKNIANRLGKAHSSTYVTEVLNGRKNNSDVEAAIYEAVRLKKIEVKKHEEILNQ